VRTITDPIAEGDALWRPYMGRHNQNLPHQYHNGGVWPFIGGFWVLALVKPDRMAEARAELIKVARVNHLGSWSFTEWFHGETLNGMGMAGQSWNAAAFLYALQAVEGGPAVLQAPER